MDRVLREAEEWVWVPVDAQDDATPERRLTVYPDRVCVQWSRTERPFEELLAEVTAVAERSGRPVLRWWTRSTSRPDDTGRRLEDAGFQRAEVLDVLALDLGGPTALTELAERLDVPPGVQVRTVTDLTGLRTAAEVAAAAFDEPPPTQAQMAHALLQVGEGTRTGRWRSRWWLAAVQGRPVGTGGATLVGDPQVEPGTDLVRLWGGCVLPDARGRGAYRALLLARCAAAVEAGARMVLVKGRVHTSAPLLRRAGFETHGREDAYERPMSTSRASGLPA